MSRNGSGVYTLPAGNPVITGTTISSTWANNTLLDLATAMSGSVASDGQTPMTGTLDLNNNKITLLANGTLPTDAVNLSQLTTAIGLLGTMAYEDSDAVSITGGDIDGTDIGQTTPAKGKFTDLEASGTVAFTGTGAALIPVGTTAQQPTPVTGMVRYDTTLGQFQGYYASSWASLGGGATGGGSDQVFVLNDQTVTVDYTIPVGKNASSAGPITIDTGITVTVSTDSTWVIV